MTYFSNFGTPSVSQKLLELERSNLAWRFIARVTNERNAKLGQRGREGPTFEILGTPSISHERLQLEMSNWESRYITIGANERNAKLGQKGSEMGHVTYI